MSNKSGVQKAIAIKYGNKADEIIKARQLILEKSVNNINNSKKIEENNDKTNEEHESSNNEGDE